MVMTREGPVASNTRRSRYSEGTSLLPKLAAAGLALMFCLGCALAVRALNGPSGPSEADRIAALATYPFSEGDSAAACLGYGRDVGPCILAERVMRSEGTPLWRGASVETRHACLVSVERYAEPAARLYACFLAKTASPKG